MRKIFLLASGIITFSIIGLAWISPVFLWAFVVIGPLLFLGFQDYFQTHQAIRRNFPIIGRFRYLFEAIRPEINQYFVESNTNGTPFSREQRSVVYQRAKHQMDTLAFGTQSDLYTEGYEWLAHSIAPTQLPNEEMRVLVGGPQCKHPYSASILNISAMSYGALSRNAILALNEGARIGKFAHNTGEGGISPYHLEPGGDLIWQIGTGYFGCRQSDGTFSPELFAQGAAIPQVKMIEIKLSQGAKPAHGGLLPGEKVTHEISMIRGVPMGQDVNSPPAHSSFSTPIGLLEFVQQLRELSGGKPVGFKLCLGRRAEFMAICKAMLKTGILPDFIAVDGGEGGTGAAPLEFSNHVGFPGIDALVFVHNALIGFGLRDQIKIFTSSKVNSGFGIVKRLALGADVAYSARAMMLSLGCIQALKCNTNRCPTGIATQDPSLVSGLDVTDKKIRVANFHHQTVESARHLVEAIGLNGLDELRPWHILRRVSAYDFKNYSQIFNYLNRGDLLQASSIPEEYRDAIAESVPDSFKSPLEDLTVRRTRTFLTNLARDGAVVRE